MDRSVESETVANVAVPEFEITPEMIDAGTGAFCEYDPIMWTDDEIVEEIFTAMIRARTK